MEIDNNLIIGAITALGGVISVMGGAIAHLYNVQARNYKGAIKELKDCQRQHDQANTQILELTAKVSRLEGIKEAREDFLMLMKGGGFFIDNT